MILRDGIRVKRIGSKELFTGKDDEGNIVYYSYYTFIAYFDGLTLHMTNTYYSVTTEAHKRAIRALYPHAPIKAMYSTLRSENQDDGAVQYYVYGTLFAISSEGILYFDNIKLEAKIDRITIIQEHPRKPIRTMAEYRRLRKERSKK